MFLLVLNVFRDRNSTRQLALGVALGMVLGLLPKQNLSAVILATLIIALPVNLGAAFASTGLFSLLAMLVHPTAHRVGRAVLNLDSVQLALNGFRNTPVLPWTSLSDSEVLGSLLIGIVLAYPVYRLMFYAIDRCGDSMRSYCEQVWLLRPFVAPLYLNGGRK